MKRNWVIGLLFAMASLPGTIIAQVYSDDYYARKINLRVLRAMDEYAWISTFSRARFYEEFEGLFTNAQVEIPNDVLQMEMPHKEVGLEKYIRLNTKNWSPDQFGLSVEMIVEDIGPLNKQVWQKSRHQGRVEVYATKILSGLAHPDCKCSESLSDSIPLVFIYRFDFEKDQYLIEDIKWVGKPGQSVVLTTETNDLLCHLPTSKVPIELSFPDGRRIRDTSDTNGTLLIQRLASDIIPKVIVTDPKFEGKVSKVILHQTQAATDESVPEFSCGTHDSLEVRLRMPTIALEIEAGMLVPRQSMVILPQDEHNVKISGTSHYFAGFRAGVFLHHHKAGYWLLKTGLAMEAFRYKLNADSIINVYETEDLYDVHYTRTELTKYAIMNAKLSYFSVSLNAERGFSLPIGLTGYLNAGVRVAFPVRATQNSIGEVISTGRYQGVYNGVPYDVVIGSTNPEDSVGYGFGLYSLSSSEKLDAVSPLVFTEIGGGFRKRITRTISVGLGVRNDFSLNSVLKKSFQHVLRSDSQPGLSDPKANLFQAQPRQPEVISPGYPQGVSLVGTPGTYQKEYNLAGIFSPRHFGYFSFTFGILFKI